VVVEQGWVTAAGWLSPFAASPDPV
jgi:hypothetical protein